MSASALVGGPVPQPPPGPAAALPPGSAARALHVELPSQQVNPPVGGSGGRLGRPGWLPRGLRLTRRNPRKPGAREKWPGELAGLRRIVRLCEGRGAAMAEPPGGPRIPRESCSWLSRPRNSPGPASPSREPGISSRRPFSQSSGKALGSPGPRRRGGGAFPFSHPEKLVGNH